MKRITVATLSLLLAASTAAQETQPGPYIVAGGNMVTIDNVNDEGAQVGVGLMSSSGIGLETSYFSEVVMLDSSSQNLTGSAIMLNLRGEYEVAKPLAFHSKAGLARWSSSYRSRYSSIVRTGVALYWGFGLTFNFTKNAGAAVDYSSFSPNIDGAIYEVGITSASLRYKF